MKSLEYIYVLLGGPTSRVDDSNLEIYVAHLLIFLDPFVLHDELFVFYDCLDHAYAWIWQEVKKDLEISMLIAKEPSHEPLVSLLVTMSDLDLFGLQLRFQGFNRLLYNPGQVEKCGIEFEWEVLYLCKVK